MPIMSMQLDPERGKQDRNAYDIRIQYTRKGKTPGVFIVNPEHVRECSGSSLAEALSKFVLEVARLQQDLHDEELAELRGDLDDDIPF